MSQDPLNPANTNLENINSKDAAFETVLAIDPGSVKCGLAIVGAPPLTRLKLAVVDRARLTVEVGDALRTFPQISRLLLGNGTGSGELRRAVQQTFPHVPLETVDEHGSSERARRRFVREIPPLGLRRLLPSGLRTPERPYDDYVALLLAEEYFAHKRLEIRSSH